jgi:O-antigen/teichoic acid export membrane protein
MIDPEFEDSALEAEAASLWRTLLRNFATLFAGETAARVFGLVSILVLARGFGPQGFGLASVGMAAVAWLALGADSGTELLTVRNVSREPSRFREIAERILGLRLALALVTSVLYVVAIWFLAQSHGSRNVYLGFTPALLAMALNLRWIVLGVGGARSVAAGNVAARLVFLVGVGLLAITGLHGHVALVGVAYAAGELAYALVVAGDVARRFGLLRPRVDWAFWRATLRESLPLLTGSLARGALFSFDLFLIALVLGPGDAGLYSAGSKPVFFLGTAVTLFYVSFVSSYSSAAAAHAPRVFRRSVRTSLLVAVPLALAASLGAALVVPALFGHRYAGAAPVLAILAWKFPLSALTAPYNGLLLSEGRQLLVMRNNLGGAAVSIAGNSIAIPLFGIQGAAVVGVISAIALLWLNYSSAVSRELAPRFDVLFARAATKVAPYG